MNELMKQRNFENKDNLGLPIIFDNKQYIITMSTLGTLTFIKNCLTKKFCIKANKPFSTNFGHFYLNIHQAKIFDQNQYTVILSTYDPLHLCQNPRKF